MKPTSTQSGFSRRRILQFSAGLAGTSSLTAWLGSGALAQTIEQRNGMQQNSVTITNEAITNEAIIAAATKDAQRQTVTPDEALAKLKEGNQRFVANRRTNPNQDSVRIAELSTGQSPFAAILGCADSRVVPEILFDQGLGDLFSVRVAGNISVIEGVASEEYAVGVLGVPLLVVLGHERCGAVKAAVEGGELPGLLESLVFAIAPAVQAAAGESGDMLTNIIKENVRLQVQNLRRSFVIKSAIEAGQLKIIGAYYDLDNGEVVWSDETT